jgi:hypothetical protein
MMDELLTRQPPLVAVVAARVGERGLDTLAVDRQRRLVSVLLDDREQVRKQPPLDSGQSGEVGRGALRRVGRPVDRRALGGDRGRSASVATRTIAAAADGPAQPAGGWLALLRNRFPSSYRWA